MSDKGIAWLEQLAREVDILPVQRPLQPIVAADTPEFRRFCPACGCAVFAAVNFCPHCQTHMSEFMDTIYEATWQQVNQAVVEEEELSQGKRGIKKKAPRAADEPLLLRFFRWLRGG